MIISFVNQKGGVGKTTTAINLASSLVRKNHELVLLDADPQGSAATWHSIEARPFEMLDHPGELTQADIEMLETAYDYVIIDAPPAVDDKVKIILKASDLVIVPVTLSLLWICGPARRPWTQWLLNQRHF